jgi:hypothetical protein
VNKELLRRPFPPGQIKQREGHNGKMLSYVETHAVIARLNKGCDVWHFEVVEHRVFKAEVVVVGKLIADGVIKMAFGGAAITFNHAGKVVSLADDLKAAASDALKKCASLLGVGLDLYAGKGRAAASMRNALPQNDASQPPTRTGPNRGEGDDHATEKQIAALQSIFRRRRTPQAHIEALLERKTGKHQLSELTCREASSLLSELAAANGTHP